MAKTLLDFPVATQAQLKDTQLIYLVDPSLGVAGDIAVTLGALKAYLGFVASPTPVPDPTPVPVGTVATPVLNPTSGTFTSLVTVAITTATAGAAIYYTVNGSTPTAASTLYTAPFSLASLTTVNAIAIKSGMTDSAVATATYTPATGGGGTGGGTGGSNPTGFINLYGANRAEYPRSYITSRMPTRTGTLRTVAAGGDLQAAFNNAQPGDWVVTEAGATWTGNYVIPYANGDALSGGNNVIVVTTSAFASLPEKVRVTNATSNAFFSIIKSTNTSNLEVLATAAGTGTQGWRFVGLDFQIGTGVTSLARMIRIGNGGQTTIAQAPKNIFFDRCRFNGHSTLDLRRAIEFEAIHSAIINCWFGDEIHGTTDCQSVDSWNTPGPLKYVNNRFNCATEGVGFGGGQALIGMVSDVEMRYNVFTRPAGWRGVAPWLVKNCFEVKKVLRLYAAGNVFENTWPPDQIAALVLKDEQYGDGTLGHTADIILENNLVRNASAFTNVAGTNSDGAEIVYPIKRVIFYNNLGYNIAVASNHDSSGYFIQTQSCEDILFSHNTFIGGGVGNTNTIAQLVIGSISANTDGKSTRLGIRDCIFTPTSFGMKAGGFGTGTASLNAAAPSYSVDKNILVGASSGSYGSSNFFPAANANVGFVNYVDETGTGANDYSLSNTSLYKNQGTGGTDPGCNVATVLAAVAYAISGDTTAIQT